MAERLTARRGRGDPAEDLAEEPDDEEKADVRPRTRRRRAGDDEEARPRPRSRRRDGAGGDDEEDAGARPRSRRRRDDDDEDDEDAGVRPRPRRRAADGGLTAAKAAQTGMRQIAELTGKQPEGVTGVERTDDGWVVGVEVVADRRIPSSTDIMAIYEAEFDSDGELLSYRRARRYSRGRGDGSEDE
jgi:hypothetical protein